jgi:fructose-1-phosphate kinase PfkB-like protein
VPATVVPWVATRGTYTVVDADGGDVIEVHEPGAPLPADALLRAATAAVAGARVVVCSGSLAPGLPADLPARVIGAARGFTVVDTSDRAALAAALAAGPDLVKPNLAEARTLLGDLPAPELAARLRAAGAAAAWVSVGADGSVLAAPGGTWRLRGPATAVVNAVGAGDALVGGLAAGIARGLPLLDAARLGVAAATDKVGRLEFDAVHAAAVERLVAQVRAEPL